MIERKTIHVVAAIIRDNYKIFATQRGYGEFENGWEFPGGKIELGETPEEALKREIKEELDTEIEVGDLIDIIEYDYPDFHLTMHCFWCFVKSGSLELSEHKAAKWLLKNQLYSVEWLPADVTLISKIDKEI
ncbi:MAG: (deoxy)nucleoside triphosphate pyrophosphohydrolase [Lachnospiraceae bacterium]|nr:(deoxy)nucleoside triphosphate pyrophosphohydrolase [Lachnospiraceae bacterium]